MELSQAEEPPKAPVLLVRDMDFYSVTNLLQTIQNEVQVGVAAAGALDDNSSGSAAAPSLSLPLDICQRIVESFIIEPVRMDQVSVESCSSQDRNCNPSNLLNENETTWWISRPGSMTGGIGDQRVVFQLSKNNQKLRRIREVCIKIPPLPQGPLSLRTFRMETTTRSSSNDNNSNNDDDEDNNSNNNDDEDDWQFLCYHHVANHAGWQRFPVTPTDCLRIRLVCLSNQISLFPGADEFNQRFAAVGLYSIKFE